MDLSKYEKKIYSQNGEDGIIQQIFNTIGTINKYYVEFGVEDGTECNTKNLRENKWLGLMMDGGNENKDIGLYKHYITYDNIIELFKHYNVPNKFDLLSIDIDYNNFYVLYKILKSKKYKPRLIITECSAWWEGEEIVIYDQYYTWDCNKSNYVGGSPIAYKRLFEKYGYTIIYNDKSSVNLFAVQNKYAHMFIQYKTHIHPTQKTNIIAFIKDIYKRDTITSEEILSKKIKITRLTKINNLIELYLQTLQTKILILLKFIKNKDWKNADEIRENIVLEVLDNIHMKHKYKKIIRTQTINKLICRCANV